MSESFKNNINDGKFFSLVENRVNENLYLNVF